MVAVQRRSRRIVGLDAARGLALIGMIAIHVLPEVTETGETTLIWDLGSGISAALFTFLAGVSLALMTGGNKPAAGEALAAKRVGIAVRAVVLIVVGLLLAILDPPAGIILTYYGVMFLMAIPLLGAPAPMIATVAGVFALAGTLFIHLVGNAMPNLDGYDPSLGSLVAEPDATIAALLVTGTYPVLAWSAFLCAGLTVGRFNLTLRDTHLRLMVVGLTMALVTWLVSWLSIEVIGGFDRVLATTPGLTEDELVRSLTWGLEFTTPDISSGWWLLMLSPYSETPVEVLNALGWALACLGAMLWLGQRIGTWLRPLALVGSMTLTLYVVHLIFLATGLLQEAPYISFWLQVGLALLFVVLWRNVTERSQGPLEWMTTTASSAGQRWYRSRKSGRS